MDVTIEQAVGLGVVALFFVALLAAYFVSASYDEKGRPITGWRRIVRLFALLPWPLL